jgi:hypothetical protein
MNEKERIHSFHIPVMGIAYTIDTPIKVAHYGISSVISLVDDKLMEKLREFHSKKMNLPFEAINERIDDFRAKRITAYLDFMDNAVRNKFQELKNAISNKGAEFDKLMDMFPDSSEIKATFSSLINSGKIKEAVQWVQENLNTGSIDVNIMTKLDKSNFKNKEELPTEYNDAHSALRGFANSKLRSGLVLSAGMNPKLYSYIENFKDFFPNDKGEIIKKIILKVSDFRSALVQGKFLAKKGLWVSEYRIESGLNCGGHAFANQGHLIGPILEEFKNKRQELINDTFTLLKEALNSKKRVIPEVIPNIRITAQGGVGTSEEHHMLIKHYQIDSVGWGSPFLLVPEAITIDKETIELLKKAEEKDLYLSDISPLGVPFNNLRGNTKDLFKLEKIKMGTPGAACTNKFLALNKEVHNKPLCTASRNYQKHMISQLKTEDLSTEEYQKRYSEIVNKSCICHGLASSALIAYNIDEREKESGVSVCPGPNMAYFNKKVNLKEMVQHIYGKIDIMSTKTRPNMFIKELKLYVEHLQKQMEEATLPLSQKQQKNFNEIRNNIISGIGYYRNLFDSLKGKYKHLLDNAKSELDSIEQFISNTLK